MQPRTFYLHVKNEQGEAAIAAQLQPANNRTGWIGSIWITAYDSENTETLVNHLEEMMDTSSPEEVFKKAKEAGYQFITTEEFQQKTNEILSIIENKRKL